MNISCCFFVTIFYSQLRREEVMKTSKLQVAIFIVIAINWVASSVEVDTDRGDTFSLFSPQPKNQKVSLFESNDILDQQNAAKNGSEVENRKGKLLSIFSIVQFANSACRSTTTLNAGTTNPFRNGTCFTSIECSSRGGTTSGSCAGGFGVCCVFAISTSGSTITQNCSYIQNPGFPTTLTTTTDLTYTINKCQCDVCYLRLDFETFTTVGPTDETGGGTCPDTFTITTNTGQAVPAICGQNTGQHLYIDIGNACTDTATITFGFTGASNLRTFDIKVSQISCNTNYDPPNDCLQYHTGIDGRFTTFNFLPETGSSHLLNQLYNVCIRQELGYCCIEYQLCNDANSFSLFTGTAGTAQAAAQIDTQCTEDYIGLTGSAASCFQQNGNARLTDRYCGAILNTFTTGTVNIPICDCTAPFEILVRTDATTDTNGPDAVRGVCFEWTQVPCT